MAPNLQREEQSMGRKTVAAARLPYFKMYPSTP